MLDFLVVMGFVYFLYRLAVRQLILSRLVKQKMYDRLSNFLFLLTGSAITSYLSIAFFFTYAQNVSVWTFSLFPAITGIWLGEVFYSRNLVKTSRLMKKLRKKEGQTSE